PTASPTRSGTWPRTSTAAICSGLTDRFRYDDPELKGRLGAAFPFASQVLVIRPRAAFRRHPGNDLVRVLDVTGLAVHAVGGVDLQSPAFGFVLDGLVDAGGAEAGARVVVFLGATGHADVGVGDLEVDGLVLVVFGRGEVHAGKAVARGEGAFDVVAFG